ncbi:hypothetical protein AB1S65_04270 [Saccharophagus degradans]|uniref:hypothetical protein n=1 Tax=Saccharophagus degradans TaxID=86304 RepID=UPI0002F0DED3
MSTNIFTGLRPTLKHFAIPHSTLSAARRQTSPFQCRYTAKNLAIRLPFRTNLQQSWTNTGKYTILVTTNDNQDDEQYIIPI